MPAYGYEFYLLVFNSSWPLEEKIHIHARACNILYVTTVLILVGATLYYKLIVT